MKKKIKNFSGENQQNLHHIVDLKSLGSLMEFHSKTNIALDPNLNLRADRIPDSILNKLRQSDTEINPFLHKSIDCDIDFSTKIRRKNSAEAFSAEKIKFDDIKKLLSGAYACDSEAENFSRPYPSAGGLYPIEIICWIFQERCIDAPKTGAYHFRPFHKRLQPILSKQNQTSDTGFLGEADQYKPGFCLIYVASTLRLLAKYSLRGYRHALIEVGAMAQQGDLIGNELGLKNRIFSGFSDYEIGNALSLDPFNFLPLLVQAFGK